MPDNTGGHLTWPILQVLFFRVALGARRLSSVMIMTRVFLDSRERSRDTRAGTIHVMLVLIILHRVALYRLRGNNHEVMHHDQTQAT